MDRRAFLATAAAGGPIAMPAVACAQQAGKVHRIGFLSLQSGLSSTTEAFNQGLRELGYVEGRNVIIEYRWAERKDERLPELAAELVRLKVEVIVTAAAPTIEAPSAQPAPSLSSWRRPIRSAAASSPASPALAAMSRA
jgi:putative ABC transport system substrate-binding protein